MRTISGVLADLAPDRRILRDQDGCHQELAARLGARVVRLTQARVGTLSQTKPQRVGLHKRGGGRIRRIPQPVRIAYKLDGKTVERSGRLNQQSEEGRNYLTQEEIWGPSRVGMIDYAEDQARRKNPVHMADWLKRLDAFLEFNERNILTHAGTVWHELALDHAHAEFEKDEAERRRLEAEQLTSDFDEVVEEVRRLQAGDISAGQPDSQD